MVLFSSTVRDTCTAVQAVQQFFTTAVYTQVGTLVPVEPLDDAYTGPLFTLWEGLYRRFANPVGALLAILPACR